MIVSAQMMRKRIPLLETCFVDNGDIEILSDMSRPERLIVGRTGIGKTALLRRLASIEERVIIVSPESLSVFTLRILQSFNMLQNWE